MKKRSIETAYKLYGEQLAKMRKRYGVTNSTNGVNARKLSKSAFRREITQGGEIGVYEKTDKGGYKSRIAKLVSSQLGVYTFRQASLLRAALEENGVAMEGEFTIKELRDRRSPRIKDALAALYEKQRGEGMSAMDISKDWSVNIFESE